MQKYLWGGAALIVAGAAACYVGADYAARHPESFLARCCAAVSTASIHCNPLSTMNTAVNGTSAPAQPTEAEVAKSPVLPQAVQRAEGTSEQTIEPIQVEDVQPDLGPPVGWHRIEGTEESEPPIDFGGVIVPNEEPIMPMPYADAEDIEDLVTKPEAGDQANSCERASELENLWFRMWVKKKKILGLGAVEQGEQCEPPANDGAMDEQPSLRKWIKKWFRMTTGDQTGERVKPIGGRGSNGITWWDFDEECEDPVSDLEVYIKEFIYRNMMFVGASVNADAGLVGSIVIDTEDVPPASAIVPWPFGLPRLDQGGFSLVSGFCGSLMFEGRLAAEELPNMPEEEVTETEEETRPPIQQIEWIFPSLPYDSPAVPVVPVYPPDFQVETTLAFTEVRPAAEQLPNMPEEEVTESEDAMPPVIEQIEEIVPPMIESNYHHHHQGCPYMGGCPYCPPSYPVQSAVRIPEVQVENARGGLVIIEGRPAAEQLPNMPEEEAIESEDDVPPVIQLERIEGVMKLWLETNPRLNPYRVASIMVESATVEYDTPSLRRLRSFVKVKKVSIWEQFLLNFGTRSSRPFTDTMEFRPSDDASPVTPDKFLFLFGGIPY
jgi:hypothetical protein